MQQVSLAHATARAVGAVVGDVVELVNPSGAPLRAWVVEVRDDAAAQTRVAPSALRTLPAAARRDVEVRLVARAGGAGRCFAL